MGHRRKGVVQINATVAPETKALLDALRGRFQLTAGEVMRWALVLLAAVRQAEERGERLAIVDQEGRVLRSLEWRQGPEE